MTFLRYLLATQAWFSVLHCTAQAVVFGFFKFRILCLGSIAVVHGFESGVWASASWKDKGC